MPDMRSAMRFAGAILLLLLAGCDRPPARCAVGDAAITVQLLFGRSLRTGGEVDAAAWQAFLARSITPRFPDGLTEWDGHGQWRPPGTTRVIAEPSTVVEIVTTDTPTTTASLAAIRDDYRRQFDQQSVGLVVTPACASF